MYSGIASPTMRLNIVYVVVVIVAGILQASGQEGFCLFNANTAQCVPAETDAEITQEYLAFADISGRCIGDTATSADGLMLIGCATESPECASIRFFTAADDTQPAQLLCLPANFTGGPSLDAFLALSNAYMACSEAETVTPECADTRVEYYDALGCDFCGVMEQQTLVGFRACLPFVDAEECAAAEPDGLEALPGDSAIERFEEGVDGEPEPEPEVGSMVEEGSRAMQLARMRRSRPTDPVRMRRSRPADPPRVRRGRPADPPRIRRSRPPDPPRVRRSRRERRIP
eukprot:jgi/Ulvmu1/12132/UM084_0059.1